MVAGESGPYVRLWGVDNANPVSAANPFPVIDGGVNQQANITSTTSSIPNTSTTVTLTATSGRITIANYSATTNLFVNWANGTATTSNFEIAAGAAFTYQGIPIQQFQIIGSAASGNFGICAY